MICSTHGSPGKLRLPTVAILVLILGFFCQTLPVRAQTYNVTQDTSSLTSGYQYAVDLQLNQGGTANSSSINISSFMYGGSSPNGAIDNQTGATVTNPNTASQSVTLDNSSTAFAEFTQEFSGSPVKFTVDYSNLFAPDLTDPTASPDQFYFGLLNTTLSTDPTNPQYVPTTDPTGNNALLTIQNDGGGNYTVNRYDIKPADIAATPELGTVTSLGLLMGLFGLGVLRARRGWAGDAAGTK